MVMTRRFVQLVLLWGFALALSASSVSASPATGPEPTVRAADGLYTVTAEFNVAEPATIAIAALTDYENIPRFMPAVHASTVLERTAAYTVIEQEALARFMMFSKRIHLVLEVREHPGTIRFRDRCGQSFSQYEGTWTISESGGRTSIRYQLSARPAFDVPGFLLKRLLKRDAAVMIEQLQTEIASRAVGR
jgi:ribosome-associated toxin RatA of RatAB toxin-antitoxin module